MGLSDRTTLKLYQVVRWGNDDEGPDGDDTIFIVRAYSHIRAAELVDAHLMHMPHEKVWACASQVCEIGVSHDLPQDFPNREDVVLAPFSRFGSRPAPFPAWSRDEEDGPWFAIAD